MSMRQRYNAFERAVGLIKVIRRLAAGDGFVKVSNIPTNIALCEVYAVTAKLAKGGVLESKSGRHGGVRIAHEPITAREVWQAVNGTIQPVTCATDELERLTALLANCLATEYI